MAKFPQKTLQGTAYDLSHLDSLVIPVTFEGRVFQTLVNFSCHCFTEKFDAHRHTVEHVYRYGREERAFSIDRHSLSLTLPQHFARLGNSTVYHTQKESFFFIRSEAAGGLVVSYVVFFRSFKSDQEYLDVVLDVSSAYPKLGMTTFASPVKFPRVVDARARGIKLTIGNRVKIKRG